MNPSFHRCSVVTSTVAVVILLLTLIPGFTESKSLDFGQLKQRKASRGVPADFIESRQQLWSGTVKQLMFEVTRTRNTLIWVGATDTHLHVGTGQRVSVHPGDIQRRIPGRVLSLDVNRMPHLRNRILIAVSYWSQNRLVSRLFSFNVRTSTLNPFYTSNMAAIRPLDNFLYGQSYDPSRGWATDIFRLSTGPEEYIWEKEIKVPVGVRLLHMERLPGGYISYIRDDGAFVIANGVRIKRSISGNFGANNRVFGHYSPREDTRRKTVRIPPQYIPEAHLIAVAKNGFTTEGTVGASLGAGEQAGIELFRWRRGTIVNRFTLGPVSGRILDVEVSGINPSQLLWLRRTDSSRVVLEMIDFSRQKLR